MTHDELLTKINSGMFAQERDYFALLAVVELHKPNGKYCNQCAIESGVPIDTYLMPYPYPCPTIQAIEKELNG